MDSFRSQRDTYITTTQADYQNPSRRHESSSYANQSGRSSRPNTQFSEEACDSGQLKSTAKSAERATVHQKHTPQKYKSNATGTHLSTSRIPVPVGKMGTDSLGGKQASLTKEQIRTPVKGEMSSLEGKRNVVPSQMSSKDSNDSDLRHLQEQIRATIYGHCIGDAIGLLTEFMSRQEVSKHYGKYRDRLELEYKIKDAHRKRWKEGDWTDDSDQMILIMLSLTDLDGKVSQLDFASKLYKWYIEGFRELGDQSGTGIGRSTASVLQHPAFMKEPIEAAKSIWLQSKRALAANGGVMRTSILGIHEFWDLQKVTENAIDICTTTHADPRCQASAVAVCVAIALMLQRKQPYFDEWYNTYDTNAIIQRSYEFASSLLMSTNHKQELSQALFCNNLDSLQLDDCNEMGYTFKCLAAGFWALKQDNFRQALTEIVKRGGDADTNGAVAGALLGCKLGIISSLPASWHDGLANTVWLNEKIYRYWRVLTEMYRNSRQLSPTGGTSLPSLTVQGPARLLLP